MAPKITAAHQPAIEPATPPAAAPEEQKQEQPAQEDPFLLALEEAHQEIGAEFSEYADKHAPVSIAGQARDLVGSAGLGAVRSGFETYDAVFGESDYADKSDFRKSVERSTALLNEQSMANALTESVARFATSFIGIGKFAKVATLGKAVGATSKGGKVVQATVQGAAADYLAFDPHEQRFANFIEQFPAVSNPVTEYLAADPTDGEAEGRLKSVLEGAGLGAVIGSVVPLVKAMKMRRAGDVEGADRLLDEALENLPPVQPTHEAPVRPRPDATNEDVAAAMTGGEAAGRETDNQGVIEAMTGEAAMGAESRGFLHPSTTGHGNRVEADQRLPSGRKAKQMKGKGVISSSGGEVGARLEGAPAAAREAGEVGGAPAGTGSTPEADAAPRAPERLGEAPPADSNESVAGKFLGDESGRVDTASFQLPEARKLGVQRQTGERVPKPAMKISDDEFRAFTEAATLDREAISRFGSKANATAAGHVFARNLLPWKKIEGSEDLFAVIQRVAEVKEKDFQRIKGGKGGADGTPGQMSDEEVMTAVRHWSTLYNADPALVTGMILRAGKDAPKMVAQMEAGTLIGTKILDDMQAINTRILNGDLMGYGSMDEAMADLKRMAGIGAEVMASSRSVLSNAGRTLRRGRFGLKQEHWNDLANLDARALSAAIDSAGGDADALAKILRPTFWKRANDWRQYLYVNNPLWWFKTHAVNLVSGLNLYGRPLEKWLGSHMTRDPSRHALRRQAAIEAKITHQQIRHAYDGLKWAWKNGDSRLKPHNFEPIAAQGDLGRGPLGSGIQFEFKPITDMPSLMHNALVAIGIPTRALGAVDEAVKVMRYRAVILARAQQQGEELGLVGRDLEAYMRRSLDDAFDHTGQAIDDTAFREAQIVTFQDPFNVATTGGRLAQKTMEMVNIVPEARLIAPYVRTPLKIVGYNWKLTPGLNLFHGEFRASLKGEHGAEAQAHAAGQMTMGVGLLATYASLAANGNITGGGPTDWNQRRTLFDTGWRPYSWILRNEDGTKTYVPFATRIEPWGALAGGVADINDMLNDPKVDENDISHLIGALTLAVVKNIGDRVYFQSVSRAADAVLDAENRGAAFVGAALQHVTPASSLIRGLNPDPYMREARSMIDHWRNRMANSGLMPRRDMFGDPVTVHKGLWHASKHGPVDAEVERLIFETGAGFGKPQVSRNGVDLRDVILEDGTQTAYDRLQELAANPPRGPSLKDTLAKVIRSKGYQGAIDGGSDIPGSRVAILGGVVSQYRQAAYGLLRAESKIVRDALVQRSLEARGAMLEKRRQAKNPQAPADVGSALQGLGVNLPSLNR